MIKFLWGACRLSSLPPRRRCLSIRCSRLLRHPLDINAYMISPYNAPRTRPRKMKMLNRIAFLFVWMDATMFPSPLVIQKTPASCERRNVILLIHSRFPAWQTRAHTHAPLPNLSNCVNCHGENLLFLKLVCPFGWRELSYHDIMIMSINLVHFKRICFFYLR